MVSWQKSIPGSKSRSATFRSDREKMDIHHHHQADDLGGRIEVADGLAGRRGRSIPLTRPVRATSFRVDFEDDQLDAALVKLYAEPACPTSPELEPSWPVRGDVKMKVIAVHMQFVGSVRLHDYRDPVVARYPDDLRSTRHPTVPDVEGQGDVGGVCAEAGKTE